MRWTIGFLALWAAPALATPTPVRPQPAPIVQPAPATFELAALHKGNSPAELRAAESDPVVARGWERGFTPEKFKYTPPLVSLGGHNGGPVLAAGALGARRKGVPKLAHVAFTWDF